MSINAKGKVEKKIYKQKKTQVMALYCTGKFVATNKAWGTICGWKGFVNQNGQMSSRLARNGFTKGVLVVIL